MQVICKVINSNGMNRPPTSQVNGIAVGNFTQLYKKVSQTIPLSLTSHPTLSQERVLSQSKIGLGPTVTT